MKPKNEMVQFDEVSVEVVSKEEPTPVVTEKTADNSIKETIQLWFQPGDNRLAMKLFGSRKALDEERIRHRGCGNWIIHPCSSFRFYWDMCMIPLLVVSLIILPVIISFFNNDLSIVCVILNSILDIICVIDIAVNFRTGIMQKENVEQVILDLQIIGKRYLKTWFLFDLISSIPLDYFFISAEQNSTHYTYQILHAGRALRVLRTAKILSLLRIFRISRLVRYVSRWEEVYFPKKVFMRMFNLICVMLLIGHWSGCLQFLVPMLQGFPPKSWVALNELMEASWSEQYAWALFKAMSHMLCIGYGRFPPQSLTDMWLTMLTMISGAICYALFLGHATYLIQTLDSSRHQYRGKAKEVKEYMAYRKLPLDMRKRITKYFEHKYPGKFFDEECILEELNEKLREDVINYNCRSLVSSVPFFANADSNFLSDVLTKLKYEIFLPGDIIIKKGTKGTKMYFVQEGNVDILTENGEVETALSDGAYFGEISLLTNALQVASVRAETYCNLFSLSVDDFNCVLNQYPMMRKTMETVANERVKKVELYPNIMAQIDNQIINPELNMQKE